MPSTRLPRLRLYRILCVRALLPVLATVTSVHAQQGSYSLRVTTREVVVDVIATDARGHSIKDLQATDFQVFEQAGLLHKQEQKVSAVYFIEPAAGPLPAGTAGALQAIVGGRCADEHTGHYRIAYRVGADRLRPGDHDLLVTTTRAGVKLAYGHRYFVASAAKAKKISDKAEDELLKQAACFHPERPLSLVLSAMAVSPVRGNDPGYAITIEPRSLDLIAFTPKAHETDMHYAMCTFNRQGASLEFREFPVKRRVDDAEATQAVAGGFTNAVPYPASRAPGYVRYVVRDALTGNMGSVDVTLPLTAAAAAKQVEPGFSAAFGSTLQSSGGFCGDLYELEPGTPTVPDFLKLTSVGSLHSNRLDVPSEQWSSTFPGTSQKVDWFGIDYYASFWITTPGEFTFTLIADDGANLYIDAEKVLDDDGIHSATEATGKITLSAGEHTLHLPYYQGPASDVALQLFIQPPGGKRQIFDLRNFAAPAKGAVPATHASP